MSSIESILAKINAKRPLSVLEEEILWDFYNELARQEHANVSAVVPADVDAHPMSGRCGEY